MLWLSLALIRPLMVILYALDAMAISPLSMIGLSPLRFLQIIGVLVSQGFCRPGYWLSSKIKPRKQCIEDGLRKALDLPQMSAVMAMLMLPALLLITLGPIMMR